MLIKCGISECLGRCGLLDLGFVGQSFTRCNGRFGEQQIMVRLDRFVADERWIDQFFEAHLDVYTDHCLLALFLKRKDPLNR